jgi:hypothetical protein
VGISHDKLVLEGSFISEDCFQSLNIFSKSFTIGIPIKLDISKRMIEENINNINDYANKLYKQEIFCIQKHTWIHGVSGKLMLF